MGRGSLSLTNSHWSSKVTLWTVIASLLLLSAMITGSPTPEVNVDPQASMEKELDYLVTVGPSSLEPPTAEAMEQTFTYYSNNITADRHSHDEFQDDLLFRSERSPTHSIKSKKNKKKSNGRGGGKGGKGCSLRHLRLKVRDLGLGHNSDDSITFTYCSGVCQNTHSNYDITLSNLLNQKLITPGSHERVRDQPCCRPTRFERFSFMDVNNNWKTVEELLATECNCV